MRFHTLVLALSAPQVRVMTRMKPMTRISMTLAAASLTLSLAPAAQAYQTEIDLDQISQATEVLNVIFSGQEMAEEL